MCKYIMEENNKEEYVPNEVPLIERVRNIFISAFAIFGGAYGVSINDLPVSLCRRCDMVYNFSNEAMIVMYIAMLFLSACFISEVVDHYDKRNNEHLYHKISNYTLWPGIALFILAFIIRAYNT
jgi:hypothetical protein